MRFVCLKSLPELAPLAGPWNALAARDPFRSWDWLEAWWRHYGVRDDHPSPYDELAVVCAYEDATLRGVLPCYLAERPWSGRVLRLLGTGEVCSDYLGIVAEAAHQRSVAVALADWLCNLAQQSDDQALGAWDAIELDSIARDDVGMETFVERLAWHGCPNYRAPASNCWRLTLPESWDAYVANVSKSHRKQLRRIERRYWATGRAKWHWLKQPCDFPEAFDRLVDLHQKRRATLGQPGCFASPRFVAFQREAMRRCLAAGSLRLGWVELDGHPLAIEYGVVADGVLYAYQSGVDPSRLCDEPGRIAAVGILLESLSAGLRAIDYLRGDEPYKAHWRAEPIACSTLRIAAPRTAARLRHASWQAWQSCRGMGREARAWWSERGSASRWQCSLNGTEQESDTSASQDPSIPQQVATPVER